VKDTAETDEHQVGHEVSLDPSQPGTAVCEAGCMCRRQSLAALLCDASLSDTLYLSPVEKDIPAKMKINNHLLEHYIK